MIGHFLLKWKPILSNQQFPDLLKLPVSLNTLHSNDEGGIPTPSLTIASSQFPAIMALFVSLPLVRPWIESGRKSLSLYRLLSNKNS